MFFPGKKLLLCFFFWTFLEDISPFCGVTDTSTLVSGDVCPRYIYTKWDTYSSKIIHQTYKMYFFNININEFESEMEGGTLSPLKKHHRKLVSNDIWIPGVYQLSSTCHSFYVRIHAVTIVV